jgi:signal transduction histidine kinase
MGRSEKTAAALAVIIALAVTGATAALLYAWNMRRALDNLVSKNVAEMASAAELDIALQRQRGLVAAYLIDSGDRRWIEELNRVEPAFQDVLDHIERNIESPGERRILTEIRRTFQDYDRVRDEVVRLQDAGQLDEARLLYLNDLMRLYGETAALCDDIVAVNRKDIDTVFEQGKKEIRRLTYFVTVSVALTGILGISLLWVLLTQVFGPLRRLASDARRFSARFDPDKNPGVRDDLDTVGYSLRMLMSEATQSRREADRPLAKEGQAERLAAIGNTVARVAHEMANRLLIIGGFARSIEKRPEDVQRVKDRSRTIFEEVRKLEDMIRDMMDYSKPVRLEPQVLSLNPMLEETLERFREHLPRSVRIETEFHPDVPRVSIDPERIEQVLLNLLRNAVEAMDARGAVSVSTATYGNGAIIRIRDEGPGIPEEARKRIFDPFYTTKKKGNGRGLAICKQIVEEHGGTIQFESAIGQGTCFSIHLPGV